jgi:hypothetical protein
VGSANLQVTINDSNTTTGGPLSATQSIGITVNQTVWAIVDGGTGYAETYGTWAASGLQGGNATVTRYSGTAGATATWTPPLTPGYYSVQFYNVVAAGSSTSAQLTVLANGLTHTQTISQTTGTSGFISLGTFYFAGTGGESVTLKQLGTGNLRSDEVVFTKVS